MKNFILGLIAGGILGFFVGAFLLLILGVIVI